MQRDNPVQLFQWCPCKGREKQHAGIAYQNFHFQFPGNYLLINRFCRFGQRQINVDCPGIGGIGGTNRLRCLSVFLRTVADEDDSISPLCQLSGEFESHSRRGSCDYCVFHDTNV